MNETGQRVSQASPGRPTKDVIIEVTPTKITAMNGTGAVSRALVLALRALRKVRL